MQLTLGPVPYYWSADRLHAFYRAAADWPLDTVYLGENVCSKRRAFSLDDWIGLGRELTQAGKQVILSSLALVEARSEMGVVRRLCENGEFRVEANDMGAVQLASAAGAPFVGGSTLNVYNPRTLAVLRRAGMVRWVPSVEMPGRMISENLQGLGDPDLEVEVQGFGPLPLAWSARCFTARAADRPKDQCGFRCLEHPSGLPMGTRDGDAFLRINGTQLQSGRWLHLLDALEDIRAAGANAVRLSPWGEDMAGVVRAYAAALAGEAGADRPIPGLALEACCDGYWFGEAGMARVARNARFQEELT